MSVSVENKTGEIIKDNESAATYRETSTEVREDGHTHTISDGGLQIKAERAGDAVSDLVDSTLDKMVNAVKSKAKELYKSQAYEPGYAAAKKDSAEIARLGPLVTGLATAFEGTITAVHSHSYPEQVPILTGYKKLLEEQIKVIDSRISFVKRIS